VNRCALKPDFSDELSGMPNVFRPLAIYHCRNGGITYGENGMEFLFLLSKKWPTYAGYSPWDLGLQMHQISVEPLLDKIGIPYNMDEKYLDQRAEYRQAEIPQFLIV